MPDFLVRRDDLRTTRVEDPDEPELQDGEARLRIERFGFTANNVTYGAFGEQMGYWRFFPAPDGWGRIPVWGFGAVAVSRADGIAEGQRFYGYFPMSSTATMRPRPWGGGFEDGYAASLVCEAVQRSVEQGRSVSIQELAAQTGAAAASS